MAAPKFVHLRVHTAYSLSEGAIQVPKLIHKLHDLGIGAVALTDTANMFGGKAISKYAKEEGIKPILGCQFYLRNPDSDDVLKSKGRIIEPDKIVLLVMNAKGYENIMHLMKRAYMDNPQPTEKPQLKLSDLETHNRAKRGSLIMKKTKTVTYKILNALVTNSRDLILTKADSDINIFKNSDIAIMDLTSTGSNISKYKLDQASVVAIKEKIETPSEEKKEEPKKEEKKEPKKLSMEDFLDDFKL